MSPSNTVPSNSTTDNPSIEHLIEESENIARALFRVKELIELAKKLPDL